MTTTKKIGGSTVNTSEIGPPHTHSYPLRCFFILLLLYLSKRHQPFPSGCPSSIFYILYSEKQTQSMAVWMLSDLSLSPPNRSAFGGINKKSRCHSRDVKQKNTTLSWMQLIYNIGHVFEKANQENTFSFTALKQCRYLLCSKLQRHALFASRIQDKRQRANPEVTHP